MSKDQPMSGPDLPAWHCRDRRLALTSPGLLMGILNVTPDSFSDGGAFFSFDSAIRQARKLLEEGAAILDVGGESTRPGATAVPAEEELARILPVIRHLSQHEPSAVLSIDTSKAAVARAALHAGAHIINDVTGLRGDPEMPAVAAETRAGVVIMHMQGSPGTMQRAPAYEDVVEEIRAFFHERIDAALAAGLSLDQIVLDPGLGFGKTLDHNLALLRHLPRLQVQNRPLLIGISRKSFFHRLLGLPVEERVLATAVVTALSADRGARIHRVHDVAANRQALQLAAALRP